MLSATPHRGRGRLFCIDANMSKAKPRPSYWKRLGEQFLHRSGLSPDSLTSVPLGYRETRIQKRSGGSRNLSIPNSDLKWVQQTLLRKLLRYLPVHPAAKGFVRRRSVADHAALHCGKPHVLAMDIRDFFDRTTEERIRARLERFGWDRSFVASVCRVVCHPTRGGLPQGAPTSPVLSNIVNSFMDHRLTRLADRCGYDYSRYADDLAFSPQLTRRHRTSLGYLKQGVRLILEDCGYEVQSKKTRVLRQGRQQVLTGLVVNDRCALPRTLRRRLRAAEHRQSRKFSTPRSRQPLSDVTVAGEEENMTASQLHGWQSYHQMVSRVALQQVKDRALAALQGVWCIQAIQPPYYGDSIPSHAFQTNDVSASRFIIEGGRITHVWPHWEWYYKRKNTGCLSWHTNVGSLDIVNAASRHVEVEWQDRNGKRWVQDGIYAVNGDQLELCLRSGTGGSAVGPVILVATNGSATWSRTFKCIRLRTNP